MKIYKIAINRSRIYDSVYKVIRSIIDGNPKDKALKEEFTSYLDDPSRMQLYNLVNMFLRENPNPSYEDLPVAYQPQTQKTAACDCGGFKPPKGHLDTQLFPECINTPCDRDVVKKNRKKFNLKKNK